MSFFARLFRKKPVDQTTTQQPEPLLIFSVESALVVCDPLAGAPGTHLPEELVNGLLHSLAEAISKESLAAIDQPQLAEEFAAISEYAAYAHKSSTDFLVSELSFTPDFGHAARVSAPGKKLTVLFGFPAPVARASAPFAPEIESYLLEALLDNHKRYVLVIDGISYAAITTKFEWK